MSMDPDDKPAPATPFDGIGGEDKVKALVDRFYASDWMRNTPG